MDIQNTIIAFDLHSVVFTRDLRGVLSVLWQSPQKRSLLTALLRYRLMRDSIRLLFNTPTDEEFFVLFEREKPDIVPCIVELMNAHKPIPGTVAILQDLSKAGFSLHIMSNIGARRLALLRERYQDIFALFDKAMINSGCNAQPMIKKPDAHYFTDYLQRYNPDNKKIIFIDDNKHNIAAAERHDILGIRFKNPAQLRMDLINLGILHK